MKYLISTTIGILTGIIFISILEYIAIYLYPLSPEIDMQNIESIKENMGSIPVVNFILIIIGYAFASIAAGFVSIKIRTQQPFIPILIIGIVLTIFGFINYLQIPLPLWVIVVSSVTFIPMTMLGGSLGKPQNKHSHPTYY